MADIHTLVNLKEIIKATLFIAGDGIEVSSIASKLEAPESDIKKAITELKKELSGENGIHIIEYRGRLQLASNPTYANEISSILNPIREKALSKAVMETLSIIAYKQPVTRLEIEEVRGVNCDYTIQLLMDNSLIEVVGRKDVIGKPLLFGTTDEFLKRFELTSIEDLPNQEELLERLKLIRTPETNSNALYNEFELPPEEEIPDFLLGEEIERASGESETETEEVV